MSTIIANYENEQKAFGALFKKNCKDRILLYRGTSGSGKTTLLTYCTENLIPKGVKHIPIQLRESAVSFAEVFYRSSQFLTWEKMTNFTSQVAQMSGTPGAAIDKNFLAGIGNKISVVMQVENQKDRAQRSVELTHAWFEDLAAYQQTVLMMFDTYEKGNSEIKEWISGPLLSRVANADNVRVVVAGQDIPDKKNIEWGTCCSAHELFGVAEAKHWMPVLKAMNRKVPKEVGEAQTWLAGVCYALKGNPSEIIKAIEGLPQK